MHQQPLLRACYKHLTAGTSSKSLKLWTAFSPFPSRRTASTWYGKETTSICRQMSWEWMLAAASTVCVGIGDGRAACFTAAVLAQSQAFPVQIRHGHIRAAISACEKSQKLLVSLYRSGLMPWSSTGHSSMCRKRWQCLLNPTSGSLLVLRDI